MRICNTCADFWDCTLRKARENYKGGTLPPCRFYKKADEWAAMINLAPQDTRQGLALAMLAGARAIETNRRCTGATYIRDPFGENGGPLELTYYDAAKTLREQGERILEQLRKEQHHD